MFCCSVGPVASAVVASAAVASAVAAASASASAAVVVAAAPLAPSVSLVSAASAFAVHSSVPCLDLFAIAGVAAGDNVVRCSCQSRVELERARIGHTCTGTDFGDDGEDGEEECNRCCEGVWVCAGPAKKRFSLFLASASLLL